MASKSLTFDIFGRDKTASKTMKGVGSTAQRMGDKLKAAGKAVGVGLLAAGAAAIAFGVQSVKAFAEAEVSQNKLAFAYEKFPALADVNIKALRAYNTELAKKTRYDDDATAEGQAILAQYGLTGKELKRITPLLQDYATATKKDLVTAARDLGKALMGQGRALKDVGVDFVDAKSVAANYDQIMGGLSRTVKGFAEKDATTAAGKLDILKNRFGEVQETIGEALMPGLMKLMDFVDSKLMPGVEGLAGWIASDGIPGLTGMVDWIVKWKDVLGPATVALGALTGAQWLLNIAMDANPIGAVILALGALITAATLIATNWQTVWDGFLVPVARVVNGIQTSVFGMVRGVLAGLETLANGGLMALQVLVNPINAILAFAGQPQIKFGRVNLTVGVDAILSGLRTGGALLNGWRPNTTAPARVNAPTAFADGGIVRRRPGGIFAQIGEGPHDEAVIPLSPEVMSQLSGSHRGGVTVEVHLAGTYAGSKTDLAKTIVSAVREGFRTGVIPKGALASA